MCNCQADKNEYPYNTPTFTADNQVDTQHGYKDCFNTANQNANSALAVFSRVTAITGGTVKDSAIYFSLRLDERYIPIDAANKEAEITVKVDAEIYYKGD